MSTPGPWPSPEDATGITPDEAFALLGNATRFTILRAIWEAQEPFAITGLTFSELCERGGGVFDDSGQFNYHLEQLVPQFVRHEGDTYRLSFAGETVVKAVIAGTVTSDISLDQVEVDADCTLCGAPVTVQYRGGFVYVACTACDGSVKSELVPGGLVGFELPPAGFADRSPQRSSRRRSATNCPATTPGSRESVPTVAAGSTTGWRWARTTPRPAIATRAAGATAAGFDGRVGRVAPRGTGPATPFAIHYPATSAYRHDHGVELRWGSWAFVSLAGSITETVVSTDPVRVSYTLEYGNDAIEFTVDGDATVVSHGG